MSYTREELIALWDSRKVSGCHCEYCNGPGGDWYTNIPYADVVTTALGPMPPNAKGWWGKFSIHGRKWMTEADHMCVVNKAVGKDSESTYSPVEPPEANPKTGYNCKRCNFKNDYAVANCGNEYICFNCR